MDQKLISNQVFDSLQQPLMSSEPPALSKILYSNQYSPIGETDIQDDNLRRILENNEGLSGNNVLIQLKNKLKSFEDGPWYIDCINGIVYVHNRKYPEAPVYAYNYQYENGELLSASFRVVEVVRPLEGIKKVLNAYDKKVSRLEGMIKDLRNQVDDPEQFIKKSVEGGLLKAELRPYSAEEAQKKQEALNPKLNSIRNQISKRQEELRHKFKGHDLREVYSHDSKLIGLESEYWRLKGEIKDLNRYIPGTPEYTEQKWTERQGSLSRYQNMSPEAKVALATKQKETAYRAQAPAQLLTAHIKIQEAKKNKAWLEPFNVFIQVMKAGGKGDYKAYNKALADLIKASKGMTIRTKDIDSYWQCQVLVLTTDGYIRDSTGVNQSKAIDRAIRKWVETHQARKGYPYNFEIIQIFDLTSPLNTPLRTANYNMHNEVCKFKVKIWYWGKVSNTVPLDRVLHDLFDPTSPKDNGDYDIKNAMSNLGKSKTEKQLQATIKVVGNPTLEKGMQIQLNNVGKKFSGLWYIHEVVHSFEHSSGYISEISLTKQYNPTKVSGESSGANTQRVTVDSKDTKPGSTERSSEKVTSPNVKEGNEVYNQTDPQSSSWELKDNNSNNQGITQNTSSVDSRQPNGVGSSRVNTKVPTTKKLSSTTVSKKKKKSQVSSNYQQASSLSNSNKRRK